MALQAFDIVHTANLSALFKDKIKINSHVSCLEICEDYLFIGFREGIILRCHCVKSRTTDFRTAELTYSQVLSHNQAIIKMKSVSALNQLLVLCDDMLTILDLGTLDLVRQLKFKNVLTFCLNEDPVNGDPFIVEIAIAVKKKIQYIYLNDEGVKIIKEFSATCGLPAAIAMDGVHICFSSGLEYCMLDILTGEIQQLFCRDAPEQIPIIQRVSKGEFILSGPGGLGVFASTEGISERPPIGFSGYVSSLAFHHPYIMGLTAEGIQICSSIDQQCKQVIALPNVRCLVHGDGQIYASTNIDLFTLCPISWQAQVDRLLTEDRIEEALHIAINARISSVDKEQHHIMVMELQQRAAFQHFEARNFSQAMQLFESSQIDCREVLNINLNDMFDDAQSVNQGRQFIQKFLERRRNGGLNSEEKKAVDTALLKCYASDDKSATSLITLIANCQAGNEETTTILESHKRYHSLAVYYTTRNDFDSAFTVWNRLVREEVEDFQFPGCDFVIEELVRCTDWSLIWRFSGELLKKDQNLASKLFSENFKKHPIDAEAICDFLKPYPEAMGLFLHFLVYDCKVDSSSIHTRLAQHYIEQITVSNTDQRSLSSPVHRSTVNKLRSLLRTSPHLDLKLISTVLNAPHFPHENAIVLGRLGDHMAAIHIFIKQLKDFDAAEEYCACIDETDAWNSLLSVCVGMAPQGTMMDRLIDLLRRRPHEFDALYALRHLPDDTRIDSLAPYVNFAIREALHLKRIKLVQRALSSMDNIDKKLSLAKLASETFSLQLASYCCVCKKRFVVSDGIARYPNGVVTHASCAANHQICPLTGHMFHIDNCQSVS